MPHKKKPKSVKKAEARAKAAAERAAGIASGTPGGGCAGGSAGRKKRDHKIKQSLGGARSVSALLAAVNEAAEDVAGGGLTGEIISHTLHCLVALNKNSNARSDLTRMSGWGAFVSGAAEALVGCDRIARRLRGRAGCLTRSRTRPR